MRPPCPRQRLVNLVSRWVLGGLNGGCNELHWRQTVKPRCARSRRSSWRNSWRCWILEKSSMNQRCLMAGSCHVEFPRTSRASLQVKLKQTTDSIGRWLAISHTSSFGRLRMRVFRFGSASTSARDRCRKQGDGSFAAKARLIRLAPCFRRVGVAVASSPFRTLLAEVVGRKTLSLNRIAQKCLQALRMVQSLIRSR